MKEVKVVKVGQVGSELEKKPQNENHEKGTMNKKKKKRNETKENKTRRGENNYKRRIFENKRTHA